MPLKPRNKVNFVLVDNTSHSKNHGTNFFGWLFRKKTHSETGEQPVLPFTSKQRNSEVLDYNQDTQKSLDPAHLDRIESKLDYLHERLTAIERHRPPSKKFAQIGGLVIIFALVMNITLQLRSQPVQLNLGTPEVKNELARNPINSPNAPGKREITQFYGNQAVTDIGARIEMGKDRVSTTGHPNCKTPIIPPQVNGCGFSLAPGLTGLPRKGVQLNSLEVHGEISGQSEIHLHVRNYEKGTLERSFAVVNSKNINTVINIPASLENNKGIEFRLWERGGSMEITKIVLNYFFIENLAKVTGKIENLPKNQTFTGYVFWDRNGNKILDKETESPFTCSLRFPGVRLVSIQTNGEFALQRDDSCYTEIKPDSWYTDNKSLSLPSGQWILKINSAKTEASFPFEISPDQTEVALNFEYK